MIHFKKLKKNIIKIVVYICHLIILQTKFKNSKFNKIIDFNKLNRRQNFHSDKYSIKSESSLDSDEEALKGSKSDLLRIKYMYTMMINK